MSVQVIGFINLTKIHSLKIHKYLKVQHNDDNFDIVLKDFEPEWSKNDDQTNLNGTDWTDVVY